MMNDLVFRFENPEILEKFLAQFCDGGIEDAVYECMQAEGVNLTFNYTEAFKNIDAVISQCPGMPINDQVINITVDNDEYE